MFGAFSLTSPWSWRPSTLIGSWSWRSRSVWHPRARDQLVKNREGRGLIRAHYRWMLTGAALGMLTYGLYSAAWAVIDLTRGARLELWADVGLIAFGLLLALSAAFVRVALPGGLALAIGAMLGLQALAVHTSVHVAAGLVPQILRAALAAALVALAYFSGAETEA